MISKEEIIETCLQDINEIRKVLGGDPLSEMPKGKRCNSTGCPVSIALSVGDHPVSVYDNAIFPSEHFNLLALADSLDLKKYPMEYNPKERTLEVRLSSNIYRFVKMFDDGELIEYAIEPIETTEVKKTENLTDDNDFDIMYT